MCPMVRLVFKIYQKMFESMKYFKIFSDLFFLMKFPQINTILEISVLFLRSFWMFVFFNHSCSRLACLHLRYL